MRNKVPIVFVEWKKIMQPRTEVIYYCTVPLMTEGIA